jgi:aminoglycoside phosphotransferase family enzyme
LTRGSEVAALGATMAEPDSFMASTARATRGADARALAQTLQWLAEAANYSPPPARVEVIETHMSWVFLVGDLAYKLKKPVSYPFLDFSTLAAREADCRDELRLNRRLAPGVYLGLTRLQRDASGRLSLVDENGPVAATGETIDWLVRMRRLPPTRSLEALIGRGELAPEQVETLGAVLASFYGHLPPAELSADDYLALLQGQHRLDRNALEHAMPPPDKVVVRRVLDGIARFVREERALLQARISAGRVVEGHGDLRPEHVFLLDAPVVIDCLEFNRDLRRVDWADEIAFLGVECERLGAPWVGPMLRAAIGTALDDPVDDRLFDFHGAARACLRARLALAHLDEPSPRTPERWPALAASYLQLALPRIERLAAPSQPRARTTG